MRHPLALSGTLLLLATGTGLAQPAHGPGHHHPPQAPAEALPIPSMPGQDAFGAVQEIVRILRADPRTDWSRVNLDALREHLIDMHEVTLRAAVAVQRVEGGIRAAVTGEGRTLQAIRRMVPAHAREIDGQDGWQARTETLPDGVALTVIAAEPREAQVIQGLGFIGVLATGAHHQRHHLAMARGGFHAH
jgi:hypothetical protein